IETIRNWDDGKTDYILAYRRGGGITPTLYDGHMQTVVTFPVDGYVVHADLVGNGLDSVIIYDETQASIFASKPFSLISTSSKPIQQPKRLYSVTLYPGGE